MRRRIRSICNTKTYTLEKALLYGKQNEPLALGILKHVPKFFRCVRMFSTRVRPKRRTKGKRLVKREREKREPQRKSLGFHIQLGFKAIALERISRANDLITKTSRALSLVFGKETQTGEDRGFFCLLFPVFCFLLKLYIRTDRDVLYRKENSLLCVGEKPSIVSRGALFVLSSCFYRLSLSFSACEYISRERMCVVLGILLVSISVLESLSFSLCLFFSSS